MTPSSGNRERLFIFDTTLRDGAQTQGVDFSVEDKRQIALALDRLGIDYIEGGWPGANPTDSAFFAERPALQHARFTAFGMTKRAGRSAANDPSLAPVLDARADAVCLVGKTSAFQVKVALEISLEENLDNIARSMEAIAARKREALFDAEHFFDGYKADPGYALSCLEAARDGGAQWLVLCDTNGGTMPEEAYAIVSAVKAKLPDAPLGIHAHNDTEQAVAVSLAAIRAGARQVQGTLNGLGERCGNANLCSLLPNLLLKEPFASRFETGISHDNLKQITHVSRLLDEILNRAPNRYAPYVGTSAFTHKGGLHVSAVAKNPETYEHVRPEAVGNKRTMPVSSQSGRANVAVNLTIEGAMEGGTPDLGRLLQDVKHREFEGYSYDDAQASFELLALRQQKKLPRYFTVEQFSVTVQSVRDDEDQLVSASKAAVELVVAGERITSTGTGNGPVNALDAALRKDLGKYSPFLADLRLVDYKVRILTTGTEAVTRVTVESADGKGNRWSTVGVSENIVDASFEALTDSIIYKLYRDQARI
ncbi:MAG TPA: citramalate synthase [Rhizomicrobium sp.]|nr:citramalate synthase [Rhizomicrobium sp.]